MKGTLSQGTLPSLMRELYVGRTTGMLHLRQGDERRSVRFQRGHIINADTSVAEDHMGEILVRKGLITRAELERAAAVMTLEQKRLGQVFLELGILDKNRLEDAVALHVHEILFKVFVWNEGSYEFQEESEGPVQEREELTLRLSTGELILEAVRQIQDPDVIRYYLGNLDRVLALPNDPLLRFQRITLSPTDGFVLSRVDGTTSAHEVIQMIPLPVEETQKSLFSLLCVGAVEYAPGPPKSAARPAPSARPAPEPPRSAPLPAPSPPPSPPPAAAPAPPRVPPPPPTAVASTPPPAPARPLAGPRPDTAVGAAGRRREIEDAHEGLRTWNHFEVLGIPRTANETQVKEAYFRLAKRFHPDVHHDPALSDLRDKLEAVFIKLGEAYEVLKNPRTRASYEELLASRMPRVPVPPGPSAPVAGPTVPVDPAAEQKAAELAIRRAEMLYEKEQYWDAIQALEAALPLVEGKVLQRARVNLARAYMKNPNWVKKAEEELQKTVRDDPKNVDAHFLLANIYKESGQRIRAQAMFRKVLELTPEHEGARAEVSSAGPKPQAEKGGGLIKKLFKKN